jgi:hypothetical protein
MQGRGSFFTRVTGKTSRASFFLLATTGLTKYEVINYTIPPAAQSAHSLIDFCGQAASNA